MVSAISAIPGFVKEKFGSRWPFRLLGSPHIDQNKLYEELIDRVVQQQIPPKEVIFIQHSGCTVVPVICKLLERGINVTLYQQNPNVDILAESDSLRRRIEGVPEDIETRMKNAREFKGDLTIKWFRTPASIRAVLVKGKFLETLIVSWYIYGFDSENKQLKIRGSENPAILLNKDSSTKFEDFERLVSETQQRLDNERRSIDKGELHSHISIYKN